MEALVNEAPLFTCACHEPRGIVMRGVYPMPLTRDNLLKFWEHTKKFRVLFDGEVKDFHSFCESFVSLDESDHLHAHGLFWVVDDFTGVFYMTHIQAHDAQIHYSFFDRRHKGRQILTRRMIQHVFKRYGFRRLTAEIPMFSSVAPSEEKRFDEKGRPRTTGTFAFIEQVGLKYEGRKRKSVFFDNEWFDARCYGVLREEADLWR